MPKKEGLTANVVHYINQQTSSLRNQIGKALGMSHDGRRDLYEIYGYEDKLQFTTLYKYSRREGIANRLTFGVAKSCWRNEFTLLPNNEEGAEAILEKEINILNKRGLSEKLERADILNRIGKFSVLFVGVPDGLEPDQPLGTAGSAKLDQVYFKPFAYDGIQVTQWITDTKDPRYGLPQMYQVQIMDRGDNQKDTNKTAINVHWTRIIHLNENALDSDIEGMGALEPVFNRILDIDKACGGAAEAYFRNAGPKYTFKIDPEFAGDISEDEKREFDEAAKRFTNDMQNMIRTAGTDVASIETPHNSPLDTVKVCLWIISGQSGIPIRMLTGEGSGQLAGSEDRLAYNAIISDRQTLKCALWAQGVLQILANAGMFKLPEEYIIDFPKEEAHTEKELAEISNKKADTVAKLAKAKGTPGGDEIDVIATAKNLGIDVETESVPDIEDDEDENTGHKDDADD